MADKPPSKSRSTLGPMRNGKHLVAAIVTNLLATTFAVLEGRYLVSGIKQEIRRRTRLLRASPPAMRPLPRATMSRP